MIRGVEIYVRAVTFLVGLVLTGLGVGGILWYAGVEPLAGWLNESWPSDWFTTAEDTSWWFPTLVGAAALLILLCLNTIVQLSRRRTVAPLVLDSDQPGGTISLHLGDLGRALAHDLEKLPAVRFSSSQAVNDHGVSTLDIEIQSPAETPLGTLIEIAEEITADVPAALGHSGPTTRVFLQLDKVRNAGQATSTTPYSDEPAALAETTKPTH